MFKTWATFKYEELKIMIENIRRNRALEIKYEGDELVYINKNYGMKLKVWNHKSVREI